MAERNEIKNLLRTIDANPLLEQSARSSKLFRDLMDNGLITYGRCGCSLPTVHVTRKGREFLNSSSYKD